MDICSETSVVLMFTLFIFQVMTCKFSEIQPVKAHGLHYIWHLPLGDQSALVAEVLGLQGLAWRPQL